MMLLRRVGYALISGMLACAAISCEAARTPEQVAEWHPETAFTDMFHEAAVVNLEQPVDYPIVAITGVAVRQDGILAVTDGPEGMVKLYGPSGQLQNVIGRKGQGPAEFQFPISPQWGSNGALYVSDVATHRVTVIDSVGDLVTTIPMADLSVITKVQVVSSNRILVSGMHNSHKSVVVALDETGDIDNDFARVDLTNFRPNGQAESPLWISTRAASSIVRGDTLLTVLSIADSIWTTDLHTGLTTSQALRIPGYVPPILPAPGPPDRKKTIEWARSFSRASDIFATQEFVFIPFVVGMINGEGKVSAVMRNRAGDWQGLTNVPAIIGQSAAGLIAIQQDDAGNVSLVFYELR